MISLSEKQKRIQRQTAMYLLIYMANDKRFVKSLTEDERLILVNYAKDSNIDSCLCCPCFAWERDEGIIGYSCTLGGEPKLERKGECPDA